MLSVTITMDEHDFDQLFHSTARWCESDGTNVFAEHEHSFEPTSGDEEINWQYRYAFWVGTEWTAVLFARAFLDSVSQPCQILWDLAGDSEPSWVVLTDYQTAGWKHVDSMPPPSYTHWLYLPTEDAAQACARQLADTLQATTHVTSADLPNLPWQVAAATIVRPGRLQELRAVAHSIAHDHDGAYADGEFGTIDPTTGEFFCAKHAHTLRPPTALIEAAHDTVDTEHPAAPGDQSPTT